MPGENGAKVVKKMDNILQKNSGYKKLVKINEYHESNESVDGLDEYEPNELFSFRYAPITSCDVERSFSAYKTILSDKRTNFTIENLKMVCVSSCNK